MNPYAKQGPTYGAPGQLYYPAPDNSLWAVSEKKNLWHMGNGVGLAILGMLAVSALIGLGLGFFGAMFGFYDRSGRFVGPDLAEQLVTLISYIPMLVVPFVIYAKEISAPSCDCQRNSSKLFGVAVFFYIGFNSFAITDTYFL